MSFDDDFNSIPTPTEYGGDLTWISQRDEGIPTGDHPGFVPLPQHPSEVTVGEGSQFSYPSTVDTTTTGYSGGKQREQVLLPSTGATSMCSGQYETNHEWFVPTYGNYVAPSFQGSGSMSSDSPVNRSTAIEYPNGYEVGGHMPSLSASSQSAGMHSMQQSNQYMLPAASQYNRSGIAVNMDDIAVSGQLNQMDGKRHSRLARIDSGFPLMHSCQQQGDFYCPPSPSAIYGAPSLQFQGNAPTSEETQRRSSYQDGEFMPTIPIKTLDSTRGTEWTATAVPQHGNVEELTGFLTGVQKPIDASQGASTSNISTTPTRGVGETTTPPGTREVNTNRRRCGYALPPSRPCTAQKSAKHWVETHVLNEFRLIQEGELTLPEARILTSDAKVNVAAEYFISCPKGCIWDGTEILRTFSRRFCLERHLMESCKVLLSKAEAKRQVRELIRVETRSSKALVQRLRRAH